MAMDSSLAAAWGLGIGIVSYKTVKSAKRPPMPGQILAASGAFVICALISEWQPGLAQLLAWGFDAAALLNLWPAVTGTPSVSSSTAGAGNTAGSSASAPAS